MNLWGFFGGWPERRELLISEWAAVNADVVVLQEALLLAAYDPVAELAAELGYRFLARDPLVSVGEDHEGVAIMSRLPMSEVIPIELPLPGGRRLALRATVTASSTPVDVVVAHTSVLPAVTLESQLRVLAGLAGAPLVLAGDLNAEPTLTRPIFEPAGFSDSLAWTQNATWPVDEEAYRDAYVDAFGARPHFSVRPRRLDYILTRGLTVVAGGITLCGSVERGFASDHAIVWADTAVAGW